MSRSGEGPTATGRSQGSVRQPHGLRSSRSAGRIDIGSGYADAAVVGNRLYVFSRQGEDEVMSA